jgi:hypothetical protein
MIASSLIGRQGVRRGDATILARNGWQSTGSSGSNRKVFPPNATVRFDIYPRNQKQIEALT